MSRHMFAGALTLLVALTLTAILGYLMLNRKSEGLPEAVATFGETRIQVELANTPLARARGLSYRDELKEGSGMLFTFSRPERHSFWMKGMRFPIDIVWMSQGEVVDVTPEVPAPVSNSLLDLQTYRPLVPADEVLELPAGYAAKHSIGKGARMVLTTE